MAMKPDIQLAIDALVLDGPLTSDPEALRTAVVEQLRKRLEARGLPASFASTRAWVRLEQASVEVTPGLSLEGLAESIAAQLHAHLAGGAP